MKTKIFFYKLLLLNIFFSITSFGADLFVYPNAQSPDYGDIQSAINAASNGDNIYIDTASFIGNVNIDKTLYFYPLHKGGMYTINGALSLTLANNRTIYIQGLNGGGVNSYFNGNISDSATVILNGCEFSSAVDLNNGYSIRSFIYYSFFNDQLYVDACELIGNTFNGRVYITPNEYTNNPYPPSIKIYANNFKSSNNTALQMNSTSSSNIHIANNYFNEPFTSTYNIYINGSSSYPSDKIIIENNIFYNDTYYSSQYHVLVNYADFLFIRNNYFSVGSSGGSSYYKGVSTSGVDIHDFQYNFTNWNSNYFSTGGGNIQTIANNTYNTTLFFNTSQQNSLGIVSSTAGINVGSTLPECRDINNTQNDIGTYGGPHSWSNYHNSSSSKAQILDLEIPYYQIVLPGTQIQFKSKAIHKNN